ncbi:MAG: putative F420-dependent oxidoreductase [Candidatus Lokiarchaeum sp. GC14_75]|nr:MAG: putative F420-dependent oxidoreductase [Candidatus Lokiarchaeum sp. GC14_75]HEA70569.1 TIGR03560 family F420-dependent LLM class oxidoreductase [archaeon]
MSKIKFGVTINAAPDMLYRSDYDSIKKIAQECERLGYYSLWAMDHLMWGVNNEGSVFEAWTLLSALAVETQSIKLGPLVACNSYRSPTLTAKIGATFDIISNGRLIFGYGAGWKEEEYKAYGFPFRDPVTRVNQMREGITLIKKLWTEEITSFQGDFYEVKEAICKPKPVQKPHPPIMIGGGGEKFTLKVAAEIGDIWNAWGPSIEDYKRKVNILKEHCDTLGRKIDDIELSWSGNILIGKNEKQLNKKISRYGKEINFVCTYDNCIEKLQDYVDSGCTHFIFSLYSFNDEKETFMEEIASSF